MEGGFSSKDKCTNKHPIIVGAFSCVVPRDQFSQHLSECKIVGGVFLCFFVCFCLFFPETNFLKVSNNLWVTLAMSWMLISLVSLLCCVLRPLPLCTKIVDERLCLVVAIYGGASDFWGLVMAVIAVMALWTGSGCCIHMEAHGTTAEDWWWPRSRRWRCLWPLSANHRPRNYS